MPEPTPSPWTVQPYHAGYKVCGPNKRGTGVAQIALIMVRHDGQGEANARLMAAAPDLLAACEAALSRLTYPDATQRRLGVECAPEHEDVVFQLRQAIRKACGEDEGQ